MEGYSSGTDNWRGPYLCCGLCPGLTIVIHMDEGLARLLTCSERGETNADIRNFLGRGSFYGTAGHGGKRWAWWWHVFT